MVDTLYGYGYNVYVSLKQLQIVGVCLKFNGVGWGGGVSEWMSLSLLEYNMIGIDVRIEHTDILETKTRTDFILKSVRQQKYFGEKKVINTYRHS